MGETFLKSPISITPAVSDLPGIFSAPSTKLLVKQNRRHSVRNALWSHPFCAMKDIHLE